MKLWRSTSSLSPQNFAIHTNTKLSQIYLIFWWDNNMGQLSLPKLNLYKMKTNSYNVQNDVCSGEFLTHTKIRTNVPSNQNLLRERLPRGCSSFWEHYHLGISSSVPNKVSGCNQLHWYPLIFYGVCYAVSSSHVLNVVRTPTPAWIVTKNSRNRSRYQEQNPNHFRRIAMCRSCGY